MKKAFAAILATMAICAQTSVVSADVPEYVARKTGSPMSMDGILSEPAWQKAQSVGPFKFQWYESGEKEQTEAKILWDDERIYFAFRCDDKHISAHEFVQNDPVSRDDCCEAFISPVTSGPQRTDYINYEINCLGTWKVGYHAKSRDKNLSDWWDFDGLEIGRFIDGTCNDDSDTDKGWVLEFSVPFDHFEEFAVSLPPKDGQVLYIGLHRCGGETNPQYSQWSPSQTEKPSYHQPMDFGKVILSAEVLK